MTPNPRHEPVFNVPGIILAMLALIIAIHVGRSFLTDEADNWLVLALAFIPDRYSVNPLPWPGGDWSAWASPVTHMMLHGDMAHLVLNAASLAAFGGLIARRMGIQRFVLFTLVCGCAGAALFYGFNSTARSPLIGASGAIAGFMAAALRLLFSAIDTAPTGYAGEIIRRAPQNVVVKTLLQSLADRRLQMATAVWLLINALAAFGFGTPAEAGVIAWEAHIGGYFAGLVSFGLFDNRSREGLDLASPDATPRDTGQLS